MGNGVIMRPNYHRRPDLIFASVLTKQMPDAVVTSKDLIYYSPSY